MSQPFKVILAAAVGLYASPAFAQISPKDPAATQYIAAQMTFAAAVAMASDACQAETDQTRKSQCASALTACAGTTARKHLSVAEIYDMANCGWHVYETARHE